MFHFRKLLELNLRFTMETPGVINKMLSLGKQAQNEINHSSFHFL